MSAQLRDLRALWALLELCQGCAQCGSSLWDHWCHGGHWYYSSSTELLVWKMADTWNSLNSLCCSSATLLCSQDKCWEENGFSHLGAPDFFPTSKSPGLMMVEGMEPGEELPWVVGSQRPLNGKLATACDFFWCAAMQQLPGFGKRTLCADWCPSCTLIHL